ncbi:MAG: hypothetical protein EP332_12180 [Bacteroidetes bacterium]|nr:MAG: hypothetical protein EP332_12180 [Bacteroidota bacterium]
MTRDEYVKICSGCANRAFNPQIGVICKLTQAPADFQISCPSYQKDAVAEQKLQSSLKREAELEESDSTGTKDVIIGGLWFLGGLIFTIADVGYIFYGAIIFGGIQMIGGIAKMTR